MTIREFLGKKPLFFDGAMGTLLQQAGLPSGMAPDLATALFPEQVAAIHRAYLEAGCHIVKTNTFGCNALKLAGTGYGVADLVRRAVALARTASGAPHFVAMDIGPSGKLLAPLGDLDFEEAVTLFREAAQAGAEAGADCILIETMSDAYELKAAVLAAKETGLPVLATVTMDARGKLLTGADMQTVAALLEGLRVDALGLNCGLGAEAMLPGLAQLRAATHLPLMVGPNAGLPREVDGKTVFDETEKTFAEAMGKAAQMGASIFGGCCGTTPAHIREMTVHLRGHVVAPACPCNDTVVSSGAQAVLINGRAPVLIGERINPTGKPAMKRALTEDRIEWMLREAVRQQEAGAAILDVNAGMPGIDEAAWLTRLVTSIQGVCDAPLQLDTANPGALEGAMQRYNGKPMINSVSGKADSMAAVFPLVQKYGGVIVALTLDENGIPGTTDGRLDIARRILETAASYGIDKKDIVIDPLTMAVSAQPDAALVALEALRRIRAELGVQTVLGVSNISFGLPRRGALNAAFFTLAAGAGLSAAILNPFSEEMMQAAHAIRALLGEDPGCAGYIAALDTAEAKPPTVQGDGQQTLREAITRGLLEEARGIAQSQLKLLPPLVIVEGELIPALNAVGNDFAVGRAFLPQLLRSAEAAKAAFEVLGTALSAEERGGRGTIVIATVRGDIHDIGKNIAKAMLSNYRFDVVDLGRDVPPEVVVEAALARGAGLVGLSALMTTTVTSMEETIRALRAAVPGVKIMVGGAVLTADYASKIGADRYVRDAMESVRFAEAVYGDS